MGNIKLSLSQLFLGLLFGLILVYIVTPKEIHLEADISWKNTKEIERPLSSGDGPNRPVFNPPPEAWVALSASAVERMHQWLMSHDDDSGDGNWGVDRDQPPFSPKEQAWQKVQRGQPLSVRDRNLLWQMCVDDNREDVCAWILEAWKRAQHNIQADINWATAVIRAGNFAIEVSSFEPLSLKEKDGLRTIVLNYHMKKFSLHSGQELKVYIERIYVLRSGVRLVFSVKDDKGNNVNQYLEEGGKIVSAWVFALDRTKENTYQIWQWIQDVSKRLCSVLKQKINTALTRDASDVTSENPDWTYTVIVSK